MSSADSTASNIERASGYLARFAKQPTAHFIGGQWTPVGDAPTFENLSPHDNESLGRVVAGTEADIDRACTRRIAPFLSGHQLAAVPENCFIAWLTSLSSAQMRWR